MIRYKDGVSPDGLRPEISRLLPSFEQIFSEHGCGLTISCTTGDHPDDDPHTHGFAADMRVHDFSIGTQESLVADISDFCGTRYFVQLEFKGTDRAHVHVQLRKDLWRAIVASEKANGIAPVPVPSQS